MNYQKLSGKLNFLSLANHNHGIAILINDEDIGEKDDITAWKSLRDAFKASGHTAQVVGGYEQIRPPKGTIKIAVDSRL